MSVPVRPVRAALQGRTPPAAQLVGGGLQVVVVLPVELGHAARAVCVDVAGRQSIEEDGRLVLDGLVLESDPMVFVDSFSSRN